MRQKGIHMGSKAKKARERHLLLAMGQAPADATPAEQHEAAVHKALGLGRVEAHKRQVKAEAERQARVDAAVAAFVEAPTVERYLFLDGLLEREMGYGDSELRFDRILKASVTRLP